MTQRGFNCFSTLEEVNRKYDVIYSSNVLEHIEDDVEILNQWHARLNDHGHIAIYVPAFMMLYSHNDANFGHYRRYEKQELVNKVATANFDVITCHYSDCIGFFAWLYAKLGSDSDSSLGGAALRIYDKFIFPVSRFFDSVGFKFLFGKNLLLIARKK